MESFDYLYAVSAQVNVQSSTGDKATFTFAQPVDVVGVGFIADALLDVGAGFVFKFDRRVTAGSDTGRGDGDVGTLTNGTTDVVAGTVIYNDLAAPVELNAGDQVVFEVTNVADTAGTGFAFIKYQRRPFVAGRIAKAVKVTV